MKFAPRMSRFKPSPSQIASARVRELQAKGQKIIKLTAGEPDFPAPDSAKQAMADLIAQNKIQYTPVNGTLAMRQAVQAKFKRDNDLNYDLDQITVGAGSKQVLFNALMATVTLGDEVIIPGPYWTSYPDMVKLAGGTPVCVMAGQNENFKIRPEELRAAITAKTKWLMICSPNNPTGATYSWNQLQELAEVLLHHPQVHVLTDDVYEHLIFDYRKFATMAQVEPKLFERTVTCNSVSKAYSMTGFRCGYAGGPKEIIAKMSNMQSQSTAGVSAVGQAAAVGALNGHQGLLLDRAANLQSRRDILFEKLNSVPGLSCELPEGAMYIFCSCAGIIGKSASNHRIIETDTDFTMYLLEKFGVAVVQGEAYGLSPYFRASFVALEEDLVRGGDLIQEACSALF